MGVALPPAGWPGGSVPRLGATRHPPGWIGVAPICSCPFIFLQPQKKLPSSRGARGTSMKGGSERVPVRIGLLPLVSHRASLRGREWRAVRGKAVEPVVEMGHDGSPQCSAINSPSASPPMAKTTRNGSKPCSSLFSSASSNFFMSMIPVAPGCISTRRSDAAVLKTWRVAGIGWWEPGMPGGGKQRPGQPVPRIASGERAEPREGSSG